MTAPTKEQIERARAIVKATLRPDRHERCNCREEIDRGAWDNGHPMKAALAAIIETQEWAAGIAEAERLRHDTGDGFDSQPSRNVAWRIREAIKEGTDQ